MLVSIHVTHVYAHLVLDQHLLLLGNWRMKLEHDPSGEMIRIYTLLGKESCQASLSEILPVKETKKTSHRTKQIKDITADVCKVEAVQSCKMENRPSRRSRGSRSHGNAGEARNA